MYLSCHTDENLHSEMEYLKTRLYEVYIARSDWTAPYSLPPLRVLSQHQEFYFDALSKHLGDKWDMLFGSTPATDLPRRINIPPRAPGDDTAVPVDRLRRLVNDEKDILIPLLQRYSSKT